MRTIKSTCGLCYAGCGILIHMEEEKPVGIEGDPESPVNRGVICEKAMASLEFLFHAERLRFPLKRAGERGGGDWKRISWAEALTTIAEKLISLKKSSTEESVVFIHGAAKGLQDTYLRRFANAYGSPNVASMGHVCFLSRKFGSTITFGYYPNADYEYPPQCIIAWGSNKAKIAEFHKTLEALEKGTRLIVIDPRKTELSTRAELWVPLRPSTDLALALGLIHVIIKEEIYDKSFVKEWTVGFEDLKAHIEDYPPERVEEITWVHRDRIKRMARMYATKRPAFIQMGNAFEHNINSFQTARAISILKAITGNLSIPGGEIFKKPLPIYDRYAPELTLDYMLPVEKKILRLGGKDGFAPFYQYAHPPTVIKVIKEGNPYPVRMVYIQGANPLLTYPNANEVYKAFLSLEFLVVADLFMTPTAALADIVLPSASYFEFDTIVNPPYYPIIQIQQRVAELEECWSDFKILNELAKKMFLREYFWDNEKDFLDLVLSPAGISFNDLRQQGAYVGEIEYYHYKEKGFGTPSGKVEIFSPQLLKWGFDPLPIYREPKEMPYGNPKLAREFPLIFTSWKSEYYRHSGQRQIKSLREKHPEPLLYIHPETAIKLGIREGDWVRIYTKRGSIQQKAVLSEGIEPRVIGVDYAWWFPEKGAENLYGWDESNINILTDDAPPYGMELGTPNLRGVLCKVNKEG